MLGGLGSANEAHCWLPGALESILSTCLVLSRQAENALCSFLQGPCGQYRLKRRDLATHAEADCSLKPFSLCRPWAWLGFFFFSFVGPRLCHMEVPRLGVKSELQLSTYAPATATLDQSRVCDIHPSSWQHWILNPLSEASDQTRILRYTMSGS